MDARIAERRAEVRHQRMLRRRRRSGRIAVLALLLGLLLAIERSPLVGLSQVGVVGVDRLDPAEVLAAADLPLGSSVLRLDLAGARARVERLPLVSEARIHRADPLSIRIEVIERRPVLVLDGRGPAASVDATGQVLEHGRGDLRDVLPAIVVSGAPPAPGATLDPHDPAGAAFAIHRGLPGPLRVRVRRYEASAADRVELVLDDGVRVRFGAAERIDEKARALGVLLADAPQALVIDVRAPGRPVVRPAGS